MLLRKQKNSERKINKKKIIVSICFFFLLSFISLYIASYIHLLLSGELENLKILSLSEAKIIIQNQNAKMLFIIFETGAIALSILMYFINDRFYESKLIEITPNIKIPVAVGQKQFGSAKFLKKEEYGKLFSIKTLNPKDELIRHLIKTKEKNEEEEEKETNKEIIEAKEKNEEALEREIRKKKTRIRKKKAINKEFRYSIQNNVLKFLNLGDEKEEIKQFFREVNKIDKLIKEDKKERLDEVNKIIKTLAEGEIKDKAIQTMEIERHQKTRELEKEIENIVNQERKKQARNQYKYLKKHYERIKIYYINSIKQMFALLPDLNNKIQLQNYKDILQDLEKEIDKLKGHKEYDELLNLYDEYESNLIDEEYRRLKEVEKTMQ